MENKITNKQIIGRSFLLSLFLVSYFLVVKNLGFAEKIELRLFNVLFLVAFGLYFQRELSNKGLGYIQSGILNTLMLVGGVFFFCSFMLIYGAIINPEFSELAINSQNLPVEINYSLAVFVVMLEGVSSSIIVAFTLLQWYKNMLVRS